MLGVLDYNMGNLGSVLNACALIGADVKLMTRADELEGLDGLIVPGQGAFRDCMGHLREHGFVAPLREWIAADKPFLGICMGLQLLFDASEESPGEDGLCVLPGTVRRFADHEERKVPQMGWNRVEWSVSEDPVFAPELNGKHFYFVHSYHVQDSDADWLREKRTMGRGT